MATQTTPVTYIFKEINIGKYTSVKHYELVSFDGTTNKLSTQLNISKNRDCAQFLFSLMFKSVDSLFVVPSNDTSS